ncbi:hypothetical protein ACFP81_05030 [Deinococcus lacus]|uniref:Uncharacterized protein n=1 Tax=Deinococcus lacus TaxID=392561 RepID=A0ABW1YAU1_9DEIO
MTSREEVKAKIDALSDTELQEVAELLEAREARHRAETEELARLLDILAEPMPDGEKHDLLTDLERRPWRTGEAS